MKNLTLIILGVLALCFVGCGHDGSGNMPDAPESLDGYTYDSGGVQISFGDGTYTLTGSGLANGNGGDESGTYSYTNSRNQGTIVLDNGSGAESDYTSTFTHILYYGDTDHTYLTTGTRYTGTFRSEFGTETGQGDFTVTFTPEAEPTIEAPEVTAPESAN